MSIIDQPDSAVEEEFLEEEFPVEEVADDSDHLDYAPTASTTANTSDDTEVTSGHQETDDDTSDPVESLISVLNIAVDESDPYTGDVPLMHVDAIGRALRGVKSAPLRAGAIATWSAGIFTERPTDAVRIGKVLAIVAAPPEASRVPVVVPEYVKLAHTLKILSEARLRVMGEAVNSGDTETYEKACELLDKEDYKLPEEYKTRVAMVIREARKGKRGTGPRVDWAEAIIDALAESDTGRMAVNDVKAWAIKNLGASEGGAIDRRYSGLLTADEETSGKDGVLYAAGVRAENNEFYLVDQG